MTHATATSKGMAVAAAFPDDLLLAIATELAHSESAAPASLVHLACTSKSVAQLVLPVVYRHVFLACASSLPRLLTTLVYRPELLLVVQSITVGPDFVSRDQFVMLNDTIHTYCKVRPSASVTSVRQALKRCGPDLMSKLPMVWLARIAAVCTNLRSVDMSAMPCTGRASAAFFLGFLDLAVILRNRNGMFHAPESTPITGVLMNNGTSTTNEFQLVTRIDWGKRQIDTMNKALDKISYSECPLVPWSDLTSKSAAEQAKWTIRNAMFEPSVRIPLPYQSSSGISPAQYAWEMAGARPGKDHVFMSHKRGQIVGGVMLCTTVPAQIQAHLDALHLKDPDRQLTGLQLSGVQSGFTTYAQMIKVNLAGYSTLPKHPFRSISKLILSQACYLDPENADLVFKSLAQGMPNLVDLEIFGLAIAMDMLLMFLDHLLRRTNGKPLTHLRVSGFVSNTLKYPLSTTTFPKALEPKLNAIPRTALSTTQPAWGHLKSLTLELEQCPDTPRKPVDFAVCGIHPGLLHGIQHLTLDLVKLYVLPPHLATPSSGSFLTLTYLHRFPNPKDRALLGLEHVLLRNLTHLRLSTLAVLSDFAPQRGRFPVHRLPHFLPACPTLRHLELKSTSSPSHAIPLAQVTQILSRYPRLVRAHVGGTRLSAADMQSLVRTYLLPNPTRLLSPCPDLRHLTLDNTSRARDDEMHGRWLALPHTAYMPGAPSTGQPGSPFVLPAVDVDKSTHYDWQEMDENFVPCNKCGNSVQFDLAPIPFATKAREANERKAHRFVNLGVERSPVGKCPRCAPRYFWRIGREGVVKWKEWKEQEEDEVEERYMWKTVVE